MAFSLNGGHRYKSIPSVRSLWPRYTLEGNLAQEACCMHASRLGEHRGMSCVLC